MQRHVFQRRSTHRHRRNQLQPVITYLPCPSYRVRLPQFGTTLVVYLMNIIAVWLIVVFFFLSLGLRYVLYVSHKLISWCWFLPFCNWNCLFTLPFLRKQTRHGRNIFSFDVVQTPTNALFCTAHNTHAALRHAATSRDSVRITRGLGPTMTARGQRIGISNVMLPQTLIMSITAQKTSKYYTTEFDLEEGFKRSMYQHFQFTGDYSLTNS